MNTRTRPWALKRLERHVAKIRVLISWRLTGMIEHLVDALAGSASDPGSKNKNYQTAHTNEDSDSDENVGHFASGNAFVGQANGMIAFIMYLTVLHSP